MFKLYLILSRSGDIFTIIWNGRLNMKNHTTLVGQKSPRQRVEDFVKEQISTGALKTGDALKSTQQLGIELGVSLPTVHLALKSLANAGWLCREHGKRTIVMSNPVLKPHANFKICFLYADFANNRFRSNCIEAITNYASKHNLNLCLECFEKLIASDKRHFAVALDDFFANLVRQGITHLIREPQTLEHETECWNLTEKYGIKSIAFNDYWLNGGPYSSVRIDDTYGVFKLTEHLIKLGHKKILLIDELDYWPRSSAINGFQMAMRCHQLPVTDDMIAFSSDNRNWHNIDREFIKNITRNFTAVICLYDVYAMRLLSHLKEIGGLAESISIVAFDWVSSGEKFELTTVVQPIDLLIKKTFDILLDDNQQITKLILAPELKIGESTKPPVSE